MARPKALIVGGGSKLGLQLSTTIQDEYDVTIITSSGNVPTGMKIIPVDLNDMDSLSKLIDAVETDYGLIVFNQNNGAGLQKRHFKDEILEMSHWQHGYFVNCQLPYYIVKKQTQNCESKYVWMLTHFMEYRNRHEWNAKEFCSYGADKVTNAHIIKTFSFYGEGIFVGIVPDPTYRKTDQTYIKKLKEVILGLTIEDNGAIITENKEKFK